jgi:hypothetical protein
VDEREWLTCTDPEKMLDFLVMGRASERKLRFFALADARRVWHLVTDARSRNAVEVAERYADRRATEEDRSQAIRAAHRAKDAVAHEWPRSPASVAASMAYYAACSVRGSAAARIAASRPDKTTVVPGGKIIQTFLLHCLFGNPFRPVALDPAWLHWHDGLIRQLAQATYDERQLPSGHLDPERLAVLADALEEAGCDNQEILGHLRGPEPHVRGCFLVDCLTGRE